MTARAIDDPREGGAGVQRPAHRPAAQPEAGTAHQAAVGARHRGAHPAGGAGAPARGVAPALCPQAQCQPRARRGRALDPVQAGHEVAVDRERRLLAVVAGEQAEVLEGLGVRRVAVAQVEPAVVAHVIGAAELVHRLHHRAQDVGLLGLRARAEGRPAVLLDAHRAPSRGCPGCGRSSAASSWR